MLWRTRARHIRERIEDEPMDVIYRYDPFAALDRRPIADAEEAIDNLVRGNKRYTTIVTQVHREILGGPAAQPIVIPSNPLSLGLRAVSGAAPAHAPFALVLGCSDARVPVEQVFDRSPGDLFVIRVAGNVLGVECLGSIDYAVANLGKSLKLVLVLGHSSCGAVTAAVESYLAPRNYAEIAFTHSLRSLVDRIQTAVRGAARALERAGGNSVARRAGYREALVEAAVYLNAAITAYDVERELKVSSDGSTRVVYGVFDLVDQQVRAQPAKDMPVFADVPGGPDELNQLGDRLARAIVRKRLKGRGAPRSR
jgi:carbonic anhydrase